MVLVVRFRTAPSGLRPSLSRRVALLGYLDRLRIASLIELLVRVACQSKIFLFMLRGTFLGQSSIPVQRVQRLVCLDALHQECWILRPIWLKLQSILALIKVPDGRRT